MSPAIMPFINLLPIIASLLDRQDKLLPTELICRLVTVQLLICWTNTGIYA
jgi:hypothetical protein